MSVGLQRLLLKVWHGWIAGGFLVAYATADENTYAMHVFAGYAVLAAVVVRLAVGAFVPVASLWRLPRLSLTASLSWLFAHKGRNPLFAWFTAALLAVVGLSALSGACADGVAGLEDPHEAISEASLVVIFGHIAFVAFQYGGQRLLKRIGKRLFALRPSSLAKEHPR
jgi:cytochrome b561